MPQDDHRLQPVTITVNTRSYPWELEGDHLRAGRRTLSLLPGQPINGEDFTVRYSRGADGHGSGSLTLGRSVEVERNGLRCLSHLSLVTWTCPACSMTAMTSSCRRGLIVRHIPYVTESRAIGYGFLAYPVTVSGDRIVSSTDHRIWFGGSVPCDEYGRKLTLANPQTRAVADGLQADFMLSQRPGAGRVATSTRKSPRTRALSPIKPRRSTPRSRPPRAPPGRRSTKTPRSPTGTPPPPGPGSPPSTAGTAASGS